MVEGRPTYRKILVVGQFGGQNQGKDSLARWDVVCAGISDIASHWDIPADTDLILCFGEWTDDQKRAIRMMAGKREMPGPLFVENLFKVLEQLRRMGTAMVGLTQKQRELALAAIPPQGRITEPRVLVADMKRRLLDAGWSVSIKYLYRLISEERRKRDLELGFPGTRESWDKERALQHREKNRARNLAGKAGQNTAKDPLLADNPAEGADDPGLLPEEH